MALSPGTHLGVYQIVALIGEGGMGEVYRARDTKLEREVAIKILSSAFAADHNRLARFEREARVLAALNHPHIASIYELEEIDGVPALVLELVVGESLAARIARGRMAVNDALRIARDIADALEAAHGKGIVHRDLKPANICLTQDGTVKVLDFGLAKSAITNDSNHDLTNAPTAGDGLTRHGMVVGTVGYMSPEQARGKVVDRRTDIWAFGCVLYEMLTAQPPFRGETLSDTLAAILERNVDWTPLPPLPTAIHRLLRRCLEKDPRRRLHDIADARIELDEALTTDEERVAFPDAAPAGRSRIRWAFVGLAIAAVASGTWAVSSGFLGRTAPDSAPTFSRVFRLTTSSARDWAPVISPDGKWVAYLSNARGPTDVWVKFINGGEAANLTEALGLDVTPGTGIAGMDISPDGTRLSVMARIRGSASPFETWEVPAPLPGPPRKMLETFVGVRWSPDGRRLTFVRAGGSAGDSLWMSDADGTNRRELIKLSGGTHIHWPTWSPDGKIYYIDSRAPVLNMEPSGISRVDPETGNVEKVIVTSRRAVFPMPMPNGNGLVYSANPATAELGLWWRPTTGGAARPLTSGIGEYAEPRLSADGRILVCTLYDVRQSLLRIAVGTNFGEITPLTNGLTGDLDPAVVKSDGRLVFSSARGGNRNLWTAASDGSGARPLTSGFAIDERPSVSPDGTQPAFVSDREGHRALWVMSLGGGAPRKLADLDIVGGLSWSRDGRELIFAASADGPPALQALSVDAGRLRTIVEPGKDAVGESAPSPTADIVAYVVATTSGQNVSRVMFVNLDGKPDSTTLPPPPESLQPGGGFGNGVLAWAPDGKRLAVVSQGNTTPSIWIVEPDAANPYRKLTDFTGGPRIRDIAWTSDGSAIIVGKHDIGTSDIVLMDTPR